MPLHAVVKSPPWGNCIRTYLNFKWLIVCPSIVSYTLAETISVPAFILQKTFQVIQVVLPVSTNDGVFFPFGML